MCKDGGGGRKRESKGSEEGQDRGFLSQSISIMHVVNRSCYKTDT